MPKIIGKTSNNIIAFEGIDGVGKTTNMQQASQFLSRHGIDHIATQELSGDTTRMRFREILMHEMGPYEELMLISMARIWHFKHIIQPALEAGKIVLIDRFIESTWAYQGGGRGVSPDIISFLQERIWNVPEPGLTIYLTGNTNRIIKQDRFELEGENFFDRVRNVYESRKNNTWLEIKVSNLEETQKIIQKTLWQFISHKKTTVMY
jgi:dTMP kinase